MLQPNPLLLLSRILLLYASLGFGRAGSAHLLEILLFHVSWARAVELFFVLDDLNTPILVNV